MTNNFDVLQKFVAMENDVTLDGVITLELVSIGYSKIETSPYENFALINNVLSDEERIQIEQEFQKIDRKTSLYFEKRDEMLPFIETLKKQGYTKTHEDSWMFHTGEQIDASDFDLVKKVENEADLDQFIKTMDKSYQKDDPQNPFGELGPYLTIAKSGWLKHH